MGSLLKFTFYENVVLVGTLICWIIAVFCRNLPLRRRGAIGQPLPNPICLIIPMILMVAFAGLRKNVGDTFFYVFSYKSMPDSGNEVSLKLFFESSYTFWQNFFRNMTDDPVYHLMFSAIVSLPIPLIILYRYAHPFDLALPLFIFYGYLGGMMNGMRQYMAAAIVLCGTRFLFKIDGSKFATFIKYAIVILIAYCMHNSAIVMLLLFFVVRRRAWQISSYLLILASVVITIIFDRILPSFLSALESTDYSSYSSNGWFTEGEETGASIFRAVVALVPIVLAYFNKERMQMLGHIGDILTNIAFVNVAINIVAVYNWIFARVAIYLMVYYIIFTVWVAYNAVKPNERGMYYTFTMICFFIYSRFLGYQIAEYESDYIFPYRRLF
ncbi:MAG: EpsG family protein [Ruminococcus sp.]|nr:EpsG family protein [Candidatus Copronaster equi]